MADLAPRPALLFDGRCGFCTWTAEWLLRHRRRDVRIVPWQQADLAAYGLDELRARSAAWWIDEEGALSRGHRAIGQALRACGGAWPVLGRLILTPPFSWFAAPAYHVVSKYRGYLPGTVPACRRTAGWPGPR